MKIKKNTNEKCNYWHVIRHAKEANPSSSESNRLHAQRLGGAGEVFFANPSPESHIVIFCFAIIFATYNYICNIMPQNLQANCDVIPLILNSYATFCHFETHYKENKPLILI